MDDFNWGYFVLGFIAYQLIKMLAVSFNQWVIERRQNRFLKLVAVHFPDTSLITFQSMESTDKRAMASLERQLERVVEAEEKRLADEGQKLDEDRRADRGRDRAARPDAPRRGEDTSR